MIKEYGIFKVHDVMYCGPNAGVLALLTINILQSTITVLHTDLSLSTLTSINESQYFDGSFFVRTHKYCS